MDSALQVLCVEDDEVDAEIVQRSLSASHHAGACYELTRVATLEEAGRTLLFNNYDVILVDLNLPDCRGRSTVASIVEAAPSTPVLALTGVNDERVAIESLRLGAVDYLCKNDLNPQLLSRAIRYAVERWRVMQKLAVSREATLEALAAEREAEGRAKLADEFRVAKELAEAANRAKTEFLANMSHELRTPLHAILSFARFGANKVKHAPPAKLQGYFQRILSGGEVLLDLLNDLLDTAKLEAGRTSLEVTSVRVDERVAAQVDGFTAAAQEKRLEIRLADDSKVQPIQADRGRLDQVFRNLISNAVKFSPADGLIEVGVVDRGDGVEITVTDQGPGVPEGEIDLVFDKFYQSSATKTAAGGTGLGLSICKEIVCLHEGSITLANRDSGGARFTVRLPTAPEWTQCRPQIVNSEGDYETSGRERAIDVQSNSPAAEMCRD